MALYVLGPLLLGLVVEPPAISRRGALCGAAAFTSACAVAPVFADATSDSAEIISTILVNGDESSPLPQRAQKAVIDYTLWINDFGGKQIDSSKGILGKPFTFSVGVGEVIPGWDRTVRSMRKWRGLSNREAELLLLLQHS